MLKASLMGNDGKPIFIFGFTRVNLDQLLSAEGALVVNLEEMGGIGSGKVVICAAEDKDSLVSELEGMGFLMPAVGPNAS